MVDGYFSFTINQLFYVADCNYIYRITCDNIKTSIFV